MATVQLSGAAIGAAAFAGKGSAPLNVLRLTSTVAVVGALPARRVLRGLVARAATVVAPKYTTLNPLDDRVLVKIKSSEEKTTGGILLPSTAQSKPQGGEVVAVGEGRTIGDRKVDVSIQVGAQVVYSKYAGTEVELNDSNYLILKEDDIIGILETDDVKDMKPLNDRVLIMVAEAEDKTPGGLLLTETTKEKPSIGTVVAVGPGPLDEEGKRSPLSVSAGSNVLYSKYAGSEFKGADGTNYIVLRVLDLMAVLS
ncbi:20 kDa chaperonin, chloroplastic-like [Phragmites australis]|uniref:20 kDa chaperonin, chloroplastic-like n=1 Tax=Phragmites australis TaxID=29695 RepID=UPI002D794D00|nr:20 kDa chaperonin, chloroplastic-like [Phragmites australis]